MSNHTKHSADNGGWTKFAGTMILLAGAFNLLAGIAAFANKDYFSGKLLVSNLSTFGGLALVLGVTQVLIALGVYARNALASVLALIIAFLSAFIHLTYIGAYPIWSIAIIIIDCLIIWALTVHGED